MSLAKFPPTGAMVRATCGCHGVVLGCRPGPWPVVDVLVNLPCPAGHPDRVTAGVKERFTPDTVTAVRAVQEALL